MFQNLRARFAPAALGSSQIGGGRFWATPILPPSDVTDSDGWTRVALDQDLIDQRSAATSPAMLAWLTQRGLLDAFEESGLKIMSLSAEIFVLTLHRPWFEPEVFRNRLWRWNDGPLSDGGNPPEGLLPAYITRLVLVRKLQMELDVAPDALALGFTAALNSGTSSSLHVGASAFGAVAANTTAAPQPLSLLAHSPDTNPALSLRQFAKMTTAENSSASSALAFAPLSNQTVGFPAPSTFLTSRVLDWIAAERGNVANRVAQLSAERSALQPELDSQEKQVRHMELEVGQWPPDVNVGIIHDHSTNPPTVSEYDVAGARAYLAGLREHLVNLQAKAARLDQAVALQTRDDRNLDELRQYYEGLSSPADENDIFVLGFVCSATPKSPDPDPAFFN